MTFDLDWWQKVSDSASLEEGNVLVYPSNHHHADCHRRSLALLSEKLK